MTTDAEPYDDEDGLPLGGYATLASVFAAGIGSFALLARRRGVRLPPEVPPWDVLLMGTAAYKASRVVTKDKITSFLRVPFTRRADEGKASEIMDEPKGSGLRRAVGDLVSCPFCTAAWAAGALACSYAASPRLTRLVCAGFGALTVSDWLQYAWTATQQTVED
jgi:hypothetical protein